MTTIAERAGSLGRWGAPAAVQAFAQILSPPMADAADELAASIWLAVAEIGSKHAVDPLLLLPEVQDLLRLDAGLPPTYGVPRPAAADVVAPPGPARPLVARTYEAMTPPIEASASFAELAKLADDRSQWAIGAPQMSIDQPLPELLPRDGKLWRGRLSKHTNLLMPLAAGLATHETIEIAAEGHDRTDGSGFRRYAHFLHHSEEGPGLLKLLEDSGWIQLQGSASRVSLRIGKRVTVLLPEALETKFGAALPLALSTLLWLWADGFLRAVASPAPPELKPNPSRPGTVPMEVKEVHAQPDGPAARKARVAVLGGGPAGLACAWLLSNPGGTVWSSPAGEAVSLEVTLLEKSSRFGGKAASARPGQPTDLRIHEHGLHVLMGCYRNLLRVLTHIGAADRLAPRRRTRIPVDPPDNAAQGVTVDLEPWPHKDNLQPVADWLLKPRDSTIDLRFLRFDGLAALWRLSGDAVLANLPLLERTLYHMGHAQPRVRPLLRVMVRLWDRVVRVLPLDSHAAVDPSQLQALAMQLLLKRMALAELVAVSQPPPAPAPVAGGTGAPTMSVLSAESEDDRTPVLLVPLATQLRSLARLALPADSKHPDVRLTGDVIELATSVAIGLARAGLFPSWAIGRIADPLGDDYTQWARAVQALDVHALDRWLIAAGAEEGYPARSRVLAAVTAGLFTVPSGIAAGTFVHGLLRLLFTYQDAPYLMLKGGTDHAVIEPICTSMGGNVKLLGDREVKELVFHDGAVEKLKHVRTGGGDEQTLPVDAVVLAIPPFQGALEGMGLYTTLTDPLRHIGSVATLSIQHWTLGPARFPESIVTGLGAPMRCVAAMDHLQGDEGTGIPHAPVYYCGEASDSLAGQWHADPQLASGWLAAHAAEYQDGSAVPDPLVKVNLAGSERYVMANCETQAVRPLVFQTGVPNIWLAGDWTRTSLSCGTIEGAVTSGLEAARHLLWALGCKVDFPITGSMFDKEPA